MIPQQFKKLACFNLKSKREQNDDSIDVREDRKDKAYLNLLIHLEYQHWLIMESHN